MRPTDSASDGIDEAQVVILYFLTHSYFIATNEIYKSEVLEMYKISIVLYSRYWV